MRDDTAPVSGDHDTTDTGDVPRTAHGHPFIHLPPATRLCTTVVKQMNTNDQLTSMINNMILGGTHPYSNVLCSLIN